MTGVATAPLTLFRSGLGIGVFYACRALERLLSVDGLRLVLLPLALIRSLIVKGGPVSCIPYIERVPIPRAIRRARTNYMLSRVLEFFPDRLATPKWQSRFRINGLQHITDARARGRPVILVSLHFGTYKLPPFVLRAVGVPVIGLLRGKVQQRSRAKKMKDQLSPFPGMPTVLYNDGELRKTISHLASGHVLLLALDRQVGKQITVPLRDGWEFQMATGALRLASHGDAELIPCLMMDAGGWHFRLDILPPIPRELTLAEAGEALLRELLPVVQRYPEQACPYLLNCFRRGALEPALQTLTT